MSERIERCVARAGERKLLMTGVVAGDPYLEATPDLLSAMAGAGADLVEVIFPASDPYYHGFVIQRACQRALKEPFSLDELLEQLARFRQDSPHTPLMFSSYLNPLFAQGLKQSLSKLAGAGVDGISLVDLPWAEAGAIREEIAQAGLVHLPALAPTTTDARSKTILDEAGLVLWTGHVGGELKERVTAMKRLAQQRALSPDTPVIASLQISTPGEAYTVAQGCEGVVVGSAMVWLVEGRGVGLEDRLASFVAELREGIDA